MHLNHINSFQSKKKLYGFVRGNAKVTFKTPKKRNTTFIIITKIKNIRVIMILCNRF